MRDLIEPAVIAAIVLMLLSAGMILLLLITPALIPLAIVVGIALSVWLLPPMVRRWRTPHRPPYQGPHYPDDQWR